MTNQIPAIPPKDLTYVIIVYTFIYPHINHIFFQFRILYMHIYYLFNVQFRWLFLQIFPSAIVSSLRMTLFKSLEGQKQQKQHSQARSRKRGACEVGNCFNIQIPGWGFPSVPSQLFYHSQAFELFTFWCALMF